MRFDLKLDLEFRPIGGDVWLSGSTESMDSNHVLFRSAAQVESETEIEMVFRMPVPDPCNLECRGRVTSVEASPHAGDIITASIDHYRFVRLARNTLSIR
jgi:hypothetical protein